MCGAWIACELTLQRFPDGDALSPADITMVFYKVVDR